MLLDPAQIAGINNGRNGLDKALQVCVGSLGLPLRLMSPGQFLPGFGCGQGGRGSPFPDGRAEVALGGVKEALRFEPIRDVSEDDACQGRAVGPVLEDFGLGL